MPFKRNISLLYLVSFFHAMIPAYVVERLFWQSRGMSVPMVVGCEILYGVTISVMEIPSGVLADLVGRKALLLVGALTSLLEFLLLYFAHSPWLFGLATFLTGIGHACVSGTLNAMLYESLEAFGQEARFERTLGRISAVDAVSGAAAALSGGLIAEAFGVAFNYQISIISCTLALLSTLLLKEPPRSRGSGKKRTGETRALLRRTRAFYKSRPDALAVIIHATAIAAFVIYIDEFWQLYLMDIGIPVLWFGVAAGCLACFRALAALLAPGCAKRFSVGKLLVALSSLSALCFLIAGVHVSPLGFAMMALACFASEGMRVVGMGYLHRHADGTIRATIESTGSIFERVSASALGLVFAYAADTFSIPGGYLTLFALCAALTLFLAGWYKRNCRSIFSK